MRKINYNLLSSILRGTLLVLIFSVGVFLWPYFYLSEDIAKHKSIPYVQAQTTSSTADWWTLAANPQRTSRVDSFSGEVTEIQGEVAPVWHREFDSFVNGKTQVIAVAGTLYLSTAKGLYAINAADGAIKWIYPTELPLGHSPTVTDGVVYFGGMDHKIYAIIADPPANKLQNQQACGWNYDTEALTGGSAWNQNCETYKVNTDVKWVYEATSDGASIPAGFEVNPLVATVGAMTYVFAGNRDGYMYALDALNGSFKWKFKTGGSIRFSAAFKDAADGKIYFASMDGYAYAVNISNGSQAWKSTKLPGAGFFSYWPVIFQDQVVFSGSLNYLITNSTGQYDDLEQTEKTNPFSPVDLRSGSGYLGPTSTAIPGFDGTGVTAMDASKIATYITNYPTHRRVFVLNQSNGQEFTPYAPFLWYETHSGNRYPPAVSMKNGVQSVMYMGNVYDKIANATAAGGAPVGWSSKLSAANLKYVSIVNTYTKASDEPVGFSMGGNMLYSKEWNGNNGYAANVASPGQTYHYYFDTRLEGTGIIPNFGLDQVTLNGHTVYKYGNHVYEDNAKSGFTPHRGMLFSISSNTLIAWSTSGSWTGAQKLPPAKVVNTEQPVSSINETALTNALESEIQKMISAGHLRPGLHGQGFGDDGNNVLNTVWNLPRYLTHYFHSPSETIYTLLLAYPKISNPTLKQQLRTYIQSEWNGYNPCFIAHMGWSGAKREAYDTMDWMTDVLPQDTMSSYSAGIWSFPPMSLYAAWLYAKEFGGAATVYNSCIGKLESPPGGLDLADFTYAHNAYIGGNIGACELEKLKNNSSSCPTHQTALTSLITNRKNTFSKNRPSIEIGQYYGLNDNFILNAARNFMFMTPETATQLKSISAKVQETVNEYERWTPNWFVSKYDATYGEGISHLLFDTPAIFQARAWILGETREELIKYLDAPAFERGDLFYIQNLVAMLDAPSNGTPIPTPSPSPLIGDVSGDHVVNGTDLKQLLNSFLSLTGTALDLDNSGKVNILDAAWIVKQFGLTW